MNFIPFNFGQYNPFFGSQFGNQFGFWGNGYTGPAGNWWNNFAGQPNWFASQYGNSPFGNWSGNWNWPGNWNNGGYNFFANPANNWFNAFNPGFNPFYSTSPNTQNASGENVPQNIPFGYPGFTPFGFVNPTNTCSQTQAA